MATPNRDAPSEFVELFYFGRPFALGLRLPDGQRISGKWEGERTMAKVADLKAVLLERAERMMA